MGYSGFKKSHFFPYIVMLWTILGSFSLMSCFTGIESTKKINLSREDKKLGKETPEERLMDRISPELLKDWAPGKGFIAGDDKALLVIVPINNPLPLSPDTIKGKLLQFMGVSSKINAAGKIVVQLIFTDGSYTYAYDTGKEFDDAMENVRSDQIPMLIDEDMVIEARNLLVGRKVWSRSNVWYDKNGDRIDGRKYVEVTISDIRPGDMVFPLWVEIKSPDNETAYVYMNFGNADNESRAFHTLFSLSDLRKHYPAVEEETWELISRGKVKEGMTKEEVKLSLGNPSDILSGHDYSQTLDIWNYDNGRVLWFEDGRVTKIRQ